MVEVGCGTGIGMSVTAVGVRKVSPGGPDAEIGLVVSDESSYCGGTVSTSNIARSTVRVSVPGVATECSGSSECSACGASVGVWSMVLSATAASSMVTGANAAVLD